MNEEKLDRITADIKNNVMINSDIVYELNEETLILLDYIASLHNLLYEEVKGKRYDCMFHWTNTIGYNGIEDDIFDNEEEK